MQNWKMQRNIINQQKKNLYAHVPIKKVKKIKKKIHKYFGRQKMEKYQKKQGLIQIKKNMVKQNLYKI